MSPYIKLTRRALLDDCVELMEDRIRDFEEDPGELAYILFKYGKTLRPKFKVYALFVGTVILFLWEFFRAIIGPYESLKRKQNGDVK